MEVCLNTAPTKYKKGLVRDSDNPHCWNQRRAVWHHWYLYRIMEGRINQYCYGKSSNYLGFSWWNLLNNVISYSLNNIQWWFYSTINSNSTKQSSVIYSILITVQWIQGHFTLTKIEAGLCLYVLTPTGIGRVFQAGSVSELNSVWGAFWPGRPAVPKTRVYRQKYVC